MPKKNAVRQTLKHANCEWIHLSRNQPQDIEYLRKQFGFHEIDLRETLPPLQRPKLVKRDGYIFMILLFPVFDRKTRIVTTAEVDFFIQSKRLITVNDGSLPLVEKHFADCYLDTKHRNACLEGGIAQLLYGLLDTLFDSLFPMLIHISSDIDDVEKDLFKFDQRNVIMEVLRLKTNVVNIRKAMQGHKRVVRSLLKEGVRVLPLHLWEEYFESLVERAKEIWDTVDLQRDTINALHETHASLLENRTNDVIKTLTVFSVIIFPMTLVATLFAMDVGNVPFKNDPYGFLYVSGMLSTIALGMLAYFKKRKWL